MVAEVAFDQDSDGNWFEGLEVNTAMFEFRAERGKARAVGTLEDGGEELHLKHHIGDGEAVVVKTGFGLIHAFVERHDGLAIDMGYAFPMSMLL
jgi:hypothetical protein